MSVNAARRSACATMISMFYEPHQKLSDIAQECVRHDVVQPYGRITE
jgi:hypothetical protein